MALPFEQAADLIKKNSQAYAQLAEKNAIILCPSATALHTTKTLLAGTTVALGAQDCSVHMAGAFTGQLSASDLASAGATYCIVGHAECRARKDETPETVAQKIALVVAAKMTPIICVGESANDYESKNTQRCLDLQLEPILAVLQQHPQTSFVVAYEPVWAIGTGKIPSPEVITDVLAYLAKKLTPIAGKATLLYGGSVSAANAASFKKVPLLGGFLIGSASLDFQEFKKIVEC